MRNRAEEDYLKTIYELTVERDQKLIKSVEIAERFGYTDQSVNEMIKKLVQKKLLVFYPYKGVELTHKGKNFAIRMIRAHRLWEVFLTHKLGVSWESVHADAEMLEHASSDHVLDKLDKFLGYPKYCQHGNPIPNKKGQSRPAHQHVLLDFQTGDQVEIKRVMDAKELLDFLNHEKIKLNDVFEIVQHDSFNQIMTLQSEQQKHTFSYKTANMIFAEKVKG